MISFHTDSLADLDYWDSEHYNRCNCYRIKLVSDSVSATDRKWSEVHLAIGVLGYRFFDEFYDDEHMIVALDRQIEENDIKDLTDRLHLQIESDGGIELSFSS